MLLFKAGRKVREQRPPYSARPSHSRFIIILTSPILYMYKHVLSFCKAESMRCVLLQLLSFLLFDCFVHICFFLRFYFLNYHYIKLTFFSVNFSTCTDFLPTAMIRICVPSKASLLLPVARPVHPPLPWPAAAQVPITIQ